MRSLHAQEVHPSLNCVPIVPIVPADNATGGRPAASDTVGWPLRLRCQAKNSGWALLRLRRRTGGMIFLLTASAARRGRGIGCGGKESGGRSVAAKRTGERGSNGRTEGRTDNNDH